MIKAIVFFSLFSLMVNLISALWYIGKIRKLNLWQHKLEEFYAAKERKLKPENERTVNR